jgi:hypothetical protein
MVGGVPQRLKPGDFAAISARLKPCPDKACEFSCWLGQAEIFVRL